MIKKIVRQFHHVNKKLVPNTVIQLRKWIHYYISRTNNFKSTKDNLEEVFGIRESIDFIIDRMTTDLYNKRFEIWRKTDYDTYEISNLGGVRLNKNGKKKSLTPIKTSYGYFAVNLYNKGEACQELVHRLVLKAFIMNKENKPQCNHLNGIKTDNRIENLEWCTSAENIKHSWENGLSKTRGERNNFAKLKSSDIFSIRRLFKTGCYTQARLSKLFDTSPTNICDILKGKTWKHLLNEEETNAELARKEDPKKQ